MLNTTLATCGFVDHQEIPVTSCVPDKNSLKRVVVQRCAAITRFFAIDITSPCAEATDIRTDAGEAVVWNHVGDRGVKR